MSTGPVIILGNLAIIPVAVRAAGAQGYAAWLICFSLVSLLTVADLGLGSGLIRQLAVTGGPGTSEYRRTLSAALRLFAAIAAAAFAVGGVSSWVYLTLLTDLEPGTASIYAFLTALGAGAAIALRFLTAVQQGNGLYAPERITATVSVVIRLGIALVALKSPAAHIWIPLSDVAVIVLAVGVGAWHTTVRKLLPLKIRSGNDADERADLLRQSIPSFVSSFSTLAAMNVPLYMSGAFLSPAEVVVVAGLTRLYQSSRTVLGWATMPFLPEIAAKSRSGQAISAAHSKSLVLSVAIGAILAAIWIVDGGDIMSMWLDVDGDVVRASLCVVAATVVIHAFYAPGVIVSTAIGSPGIAARTNVYLLISTLVICAPVTIYAGVLGAMLSIGMPAAVFLLLGSVKIFRSSGLSLAKTALLTVAWTALASIALFGVDTLCGQYIGNDLAGSLVAVVVWLVLLMASFLIIAYFRRPFRSSLLRGREA